MAKISRFKEYCQNRLNENAIDVSKLIIYDFDGTLFNSPDSETGKDLYKDVTGEPWPHRGWWGRLETLSPPLVPEMPGPEWYITKSVESCKNDLSDPEATVVLMTGRPNQFRRRITQILDHAGLKMDGYFLTGQPGTVGSSTFEIKFNFILGLLNPNYKTLEIHEDRPDQILKFKAFVPEVKTKFPNIEKIVINDIPNNVSHEH
jgi:hypothetical protein